MANGNNNTLKDKLEDHQIEEIRRNSDEANRLVEEIRQTRSKLRDLLRRQHDLGVVVMPDKVTGEESEFRQFYTLSMTPNPLDLSFDFDDPQNKVLTDVRLKATGDVLILMQCEPVEAPPPPPPEPDDEPGPGDDNDPENDN